MADTIKSALRDARALLAEKGVESAALDARLLLQHVTELRHEELIAGENKTLSPIQSELFRTLINRRLAFEPVSRILGEREFYGRTFEVTPDVLDPRPDTETLIDAALVLKPKHILDLGSGSGAIIVTLLAELPQATGVAVDVSPEALAVTKQNAENNGVAARLTAIQSSWFENVTGKFDLILSNPPYIPRADISELAPDVVNFDPHLALDGGDDGLSCYRIIATRAADFLSPDGSVMLEIGSGQDIDIKQIFMTHGFRFTAVKRDLAGHNRVLVFQI